MKKEIKIVIKQLSVTGGNYPINLVNEKFKNSKYREVSNIIFPFGVNESQYSAVVNALENQYTIIEGPPGIGKTQTILNIVANLIMDRKTMCIISATNAAVDNIYEKLEENELHETQQEYNHLIRMFTKSSLESSRFVNLLDSKMIIIYTKFLEVTTCKKALT